MPCPNQRSKISQRNTTYHPIVTLFHRDLLIYFSKNPNIKAVFEEVNSADRAYAAKTIPFMPTDLILQYFDASLKQTCFYMN